MQIDIDRIEQLPNKPLYILVAGGIAAGKSTIVEQYIKSIPIMDIDNTMAELGFVDYSPEQLGIAMKQITVDVEKMMDQKESLVAMGTAANLPFTINRLHWAKMLGYFTILLYIDTPVDQALKQNDHRVSSGGRGSTAQAHKIEKTNIGAARTVATLKDTALVDFFCHHQNFRNI